MCFDKRVAKRMGRPFAIDRDLLFMVVWRRQQWPWSWCCYEARRHCHAKDSLACCCSSRGLVASPTLRLVLAQEPYWDRFTFLRGPVSSSPSCKQQLAPRYTFMKTISEWSLARARRRKVEQLLQSQKLRYLRRKNQRPSYQYYSLTVNRYEVFCFSMDICMTLPAN